MTFQYTAFLLAILSELEIPEFQKTTVQTPDITIRYGKISPELTGATTTVGPWQAKPEAFQLAIDSVARYLVTDGNLILVDKCASASDSDVRNFLLGSAMAAVLQQRALLTLHASAIQSDKGALLFLGKSGYGKSTLMQQMGQRGFTMISDDITAIRLGPEGAMAIPSYPRTRLTRQSLKVLGFSQEHELIGSSIEKYNVPVPHICHQLLPVHTVCFLALGQNPKPEITPIANRLALPDVMRLTYRGNFMKAMQMQKARFEVAAGLVQTASFYRVERSGNAPSFDVLADQLIARLGIKP